FEIHAADDHPVLFYLSRGDADRVGDLGLRPGLFQSFLVRFQIGEMQEILGPDVLEKHLILVVIEKDLEVFCASYAVMVVAFGTYEKIFPEFGYRTDIVAVGAFGPETFGGLLLFRG